MMMMKIVMMNLSVVIIKHQVAVCHKIATDDRIKCT